MTKKSTLVTEAERIWAALPDRRGTALYLMARADEDLDPYYADDRWGTFDRRFGAAVSAEEFAAMLDVSPLAIEVASVVWPALSKGWSRGEVVARRLDAFLDDTGRAGRHRRAAREDRPRNPEARVRGAAHRADIAPLHAVLARPRGAVARPTRALGPLVADTRRPPLRKVSET